MALSTKLQQARAWLSRSRQFRAKDNISTIMRLHSDFESTRARIRASGTDSLSHFGNSYSFEGGLLLQQNPDEFAALTLFLRDRARHGNYVEIGSASGGACLFLYREVGFRNVLSLDDGQHPRAVAQPEHFAQVKNFKQFIGDSHSEAARLFLEENLEEKIDVAFIDGDHSYEGVTQDIQLVSPFCRDGAIMILHDIIACEGVKRAWEEIVQNRLVQPLAEFIGKERPLGIAVGQVVLQGRDA